MIATIPIPRARRYTDATADCRVWTYGDWRIQERRSRYFLRSNHRRKLDYLVQRRHPQWKCWDNVSRHHTKTAAFESLLAILASEADRVPAPAD